MYTKSYIKEIPHYSTGRLHWIKLEVNTLANSQKSELAIKLKDIIQSGFHRQVSYNISNVLSAIDNYSTVYLLKDDFHNLYGFGMCNKIPKLNLTYLGKICIIKEHQNKGYGKNLLDILKSFTPSFLCAKTQNPLLMSLFEKLGPTYPFDKTYDSVLGKDILVELVKYTILQRDDICEELLTRGIIRNAYNGRLGRYSSAIYSRHKGLNRDEGDAYLICTQLKT